MTNARHVTPHPDGGWQVTALGTGRPSARTPTQAEAIDTTPPGHDPTHPETHADHRSPGPAVARSGPLDLCAVEHAGEAVGGKAVAAGDDVVVEVERG